MKELITLLQLLASVASTVGQTHVRGGTAQAHREESAGGRVLKLRLMNADTDQPIPGYDPLNPSTTIDISTLPTANLNVEAITDGSVGSLQWSFNGALRNEDTPVWSLCGNSGPDFFACSRLKVGSNATITATPFLGKGASGAAGTSVSIELALVKANVNPPVGMTLTLMNADTDMEIGPLLNDTVIDLAQTPRVNVRANVDPSLSILSVQFALDGRVVRVENGAPFALFGNAGNDYFPWTPLVGRHVITGFAFGSPGAQGTLWSSQAVSIVVQAAAPAPTPATVPLAPPVRPPVPVVVVPTVPVVAPTVSPAPVMPVPIYFGNDTVKPKLLKMVIFDPVVDVSDGQAAYSVVQFTVQDDNSGIRRCLVSVGGENWLYNDSDEYIPSANTGSRIMTFNLTLEFRPLIRQGKYNLAVLLSDNNFNSVDLYYPSLVEQGYPSSIQVINSNQDILPPKVLRFVATTSSTVDVSRSSGSVAYLVELEDTGFGVSSCSIFATGGGRFIEEFQFLDPPVVGRYTFNLYVDIPEFAQPGNYSLRLILSDDDRNQVTIESPELAELGYPSMIEVVNSMPDVTPPALSTFTTTFTTTRPLVVNTTDAGSYIAFSLTAMDGKSGVWGCRVIATYDTDKEISDSPRFLPFPIKEVFSFTAFFPFDQNSWKGIYKLSVRLSDYDDNEVVISSDELVARGFPGAFTVV